MKKVKVYGWIGRRYEAWLIADTRNSQTREIVAAHSLADVSRITGTRKSGLFNICETGNKAEIETAMQSPGAVYWKPLDGRGGWTKAQPAPAQPAAPQEVES